MEEHMAESNETKTNFAGTYFDKDFVLKLSYWAGIAAWIVLGAYLLNWLIAFSQFLVNFGNGLFYSKGMNPFDVVNFFTPYLMLPLPGFVYFIGLQSVSKALLILMDMEDDLRRAARK
jgi:hypothetical protein